MENNWLQYITAIGSIATPIFVLILTGVGWKFRNTFERKMKLEEKLRNDRINIYNTILEPYVILLMSDTGWQKDHKNKSKDKNAFAQSILFSLEYRKMAFQLSLIGNDEVVKSYNNLMQYFFNADLSNDDKLSERTKDIMSLLGKFLLEVRKSVGNESTKLTNWNMLEWMITDIKKYTA